MGRVKFGQIVCNAQGNVGDDIQSIAASLHLPRIDVSIDRESIHLYRGDEPVALVMNGWFSANPDAWPPAPEIRPIFASFHVAGQFKQTIRRHVDYLKKFEPIGTRDTATRDFLRSIGVKAETTYCLTLTFPTRQSAPRNGIVYLVDAGSIAVPKSLRVGAVKMSHAVAPLGHEVTIPYARRLLDMYLDTAKLVVTTRLHAALPCIAMGIPVVYFGDGADGRTSIINEIGGKIYNARLHSKSWARGALGRITEQVDWSPSTPDIHAVKANLAKAVAERIAAIL
jgi:hypothetical protein